MLRSVDMPVSPLIDSIICFMIIVNFGISPIIYFVFQRDFRHVLLAWLKSISCIDNCRESLNLSTIRSSTDGSYDDALNQPSTTKGSVTVTANGGMSSVEVVPAYC